MSGELFTAIVAILGLVVTSGLQILSWRRDRKEKREQEVMEHRKEALLSALQAIDHVYANTKWNDKDPMNPHAWDITLARDAMNKMMIYCKNPNRTVEAFAKAVGLSGSYGPGDLQEFRRIVCEELELPAPNYKNNERLWIGKLEGSK